MSQKRNVAGKAGGCHYRSLPRKEEGGGEKKAGVRRRQI